MSETKESAIKLFGKTIFPADTNLLPSFNASEHNSSDKDAAMGERTEDRSVEAMSMAYSEESSCEETLSGGIDCDRRSANTLCCDEQGTDMSNVQERFVKRPDKIIPCPRCKSMDTKFCYYNNYNVKQPRHFCKNCQRYWTDGGSMRNVPVGAGRRKNKSFASFPCRSMDFNGDHPYAWDWSSEMVQSRGDEKRENIYEGISPPPVSYLLGILTSKSLEASSTFYPPKSSSCSCSPPRGGHCNMSWLPQPYLSNPSVARRGLKFPILGKHARDGRVQELEYSSENEAVKGEQSLSTQKSSKGR